jgi:hypothetical protein
VSRLTSCGVFRARLTSLINAFIVIVGFHFRRATTSSITVWTVAIIGARPRRFVSPFALCAARRLRINVRPSLRTSVSRNARVEV